jgi:superfamily I DNA/RNA helicase
VPPIEARPDAPEGVIRSIDEEHVHRELTPGDLVLCRLTAPLVKLCIHLIQHGKAARVRGRDIAKQLTDLIAAVYDFAQQGAFLQNRSATAEGIYQDFGYWLDLYQRMQVAKLEQREGNESRIQSLQDRIAAVLVWYESYAAGSVNALKAKIEELFSDDKVPIMLSTVHRAKGLENRRVMLLKPHKLPLEWNGQHEWQRVQERNLKYVALTRATEELWFVIEPGQRSEAEMEQRTAVHPEGERHSE